MGKVYEGYDPLTQRKVAIKALKDEILAQDESGEYRQRFQREARAAASVFQPLDPAKAMITERIKDSFDPQRILNPGRMYGGL